MFDSVESARTASSPAMAKKTITKAKKPTGAEEVPGQAERLRRLRIAFGYDTAAAFALFIGISPQRYGNFETGMPLSREIAFRLVKKFPGLSLDWLYFGKAEALPLELARRLGVFDEPGKRTTA